MRTFIGINLTISKPLLTVDQVPCLKREAELIHESIPRITAVNHPYLVHSDPYPYYGNTNANVLDSYRLLVRHIANNDSCSCSRLFGFETYLI